MTLIFRLIKTGQKIRETGQKIKENGHKSLFEGFPAAAIMVVKSAMVVLWCKEERRGRTK